MKYYSWDNVKNEKLRTEREVAFEDVVFAIKNGKLLEDGEHPNKEKYKGQRILVVEIDGYIYIVPYVEKEEEIFLKTIIPSRKLTRRYAKRRGEENGKI